MQVVANSIILKHFRKIDIFKLDLGFNLKGAVQTKPDPEIKFKIKDEFIKKYQTFTNRYISKFGDIGSLKFYEDLQLPHNELHVYNDENIYEILMTSDDFQRDSKVYLGEIIKLIDGGIAETENQKIERDELEKKKQKIYTNMPESIERPDISLPKEQYLEALVERRKKLNAQ